MWPAVYLSKDDEDFNCTIQNMEMLRIETICETMQAQISNLKYRDQEIHGLEEAVGWTSGHWRMCSLLDRELAAQFTSKMHVLSDSVLSLGGTCQEHLEAAKHWGNHRIRIFVRSPEYQPYYDITGIPVECVWKIYVGKTTNEILQRIQTMMEEKGTKPAQFEDSIILTTLDKKQPRTSVVTTQHKSSIMYEISNQDIGHLVDVEKRMSGMEA